MGRVVSLGGNLLQVQVLWHFPVGKGKGSPSLCLPSQVGGSSGESLGSLGRACKMRT